MEENTSLLQEALPHRQGFKENRFSDQVTGYLA